MTIGSIPLRYKVEIDPDQCMLCGRCVDNCSYGVFRKDGDAIRVNSRNCVACHRCTAFCPRDAISIYEKPTDYRSHPVWTREVRENIFNQAKTGKIILAGMGNALPYPIIFDRLVLDACQVTNPSIDPLREPMELRTYLGKKPSSLSIKESAHGDVELLTKLSPNLQIETPIMIGHMSYGAISLNAQTALAKAVSRIGTFMGTGEGGLHESLYPYQKNMIVQVASGRFGVDINYLERGAAIEIKIGQGAKPGIGGHLPGEKVCADVSCTRMIPEGSDAISPAPHHDIYSIEDLKQTRSRFKRSDRVEETRLCEDCSGAQLCCNCRRNRTFFCRCCRNRWIPRWYRCSPAGVPGSCRDPHRSRSCKRGRQTSPAGNQKQGFDYRKWRDPRKC